MNYKSKCCGADCYIEGQAGDTNYACSKCCKSCDIILEREVIKMAEQKRGQLTDRIIKKSEELLGYAIPQQELRLMVYIQYVMVNEQHINIEKVNNEERKILSKWREAGHIVGGAAQLSITEEFWDAICEIVFLGYVDIN